MCFPPGGEHKHYFAHCAPLRGDTLSIIILMLPTGGKHIEDNNVYLVHFSICACHLCAGAILILSASFQRYRVFPKGNPEVSIIMLVLSPPPPGGAH